MFEVGLGELLLVFIVALVFLDAKRLPELARALGKALGQLQQIIQQTRLGYHKSYRQDDEHEL